MAGRTPAEAVNNFLEPLGRAASCVTDTVLNVRGGYFPSPSPHTILLGDGSAVRVSAGYALRLTQHYQVTEAPGEGGPWAVAIVGYVYRVDTSEGRELFAYHWHPSGPSPIDAPHLHIEAASGILPALAASHFPTGRIAIQDLISLLIRELRVPPRRDDWEEVLRQTRQASAT